MFVVNEKFPKHALNFLLRPVLPLKAFGVSIKPANPHHGAFE
jgi:hypothetical protein